MSEAKPRKKGSKGGKHQFVRQEGGMADKLEFMVGLIKAGKKKEQVVKEAMKKFPEMKESYAMPLFYRANKAFKDKKVKK